MKYAYIVETKIGEESHVSGVYSSFPRAHDAVARIITDAGFLPLEWEHVHDFADDTAYFIFKAEDDYQLRIHKLFMNQGTEYSYCLPKDEMAKSVEKDKELKKNEYRKILTEGREEANESYSRV